MHEALDKSGKYFIISVGHLKIIGQYIDLCVKPFAKSRKVHQSKRGNIHKSRTVVSPKRGTLDKSRAIDRPKCGTLKMAWNYIDSRLGLFRKGRSERGKLDKLSVINLTNTGQYTDLSVGYLKMAWNTSTQE